MTKQLRIESLLEELEQIEEEYNLNNKFYQNFQWLKDTSNTKKSFDTMIELELDKAATLAQLTKVTFS